MLKIIIADDEKYICALLRNLVDWDKLGLEIIGETSDGISTFNMICEQNPDIVITDIKMPGMDGLEIVKKVQDRGLRTSFLLISGHKDFKYAHAAIKFGVENYLLKPINKQELEEVLNKICKRILSDTKEIEIKIRNQRLIEQNAIILRNQFMSNLVKKETWDCKDINELNNTYSLRFNPGFFRVLVVKPGEKGAFNNNQSDIILNKIRDLFSDKLSIVCFDVISFKTPFEVVFVINYDNPDFIKIYLKEIYEIGKMKFFEYCIITFGVSNECDSPFLLDSSEALDSVKFRISMGSERIYYYSEHNFPRTRLISGPIQTRFINLMDTIDKVGLDKQFNELENEIMQNNANPVDIYEAARDIAEIFLNRLKILYKGDVVPLSTRQIDQIINKAKTIHELINDIKRLIFDSIDCYNARHSAEDTRCIRLAKKYISEHYQEHITLEEISKLVYLNPVYFSVYFKKIEGLNYIDYLTKYRVDKSKELLKDFSISIAEVGKRIGYKNARYFSRVFLDNVGIKPSEYRKLYS
jgi:two-component system response regulator YesN